jgi:hypothetical protein
MMRGAGPPMIRLDHIQRPNGEPRRSIEPRGFMGSSRAVWFGIFIGSAIGGLVPELWGASTFSYSSVVFSGIGGFAGLWMGLKLSN